MKKNILKFGVVSAMGRGATLASIYNKHPNAELVAMCDKNKAAFKEGRRYSDLKKGSYREYQSLDEMLSKEQLDWVLVCSGDLTHYNMGKKILQSGCNLFVEKPMCVSIEEADNLWKTEQKTGLAVVVSCELRYNIAVRKFREFLRRGDIGKIVLGYCLCTQNRGHTYFRRKYRHKSYGSSPLLQKGIHLVDLVNDFVNSDPVKVYASGGMDLFGGREDCRGRVCSNCSEANTCNFYVPDSAVSEKKGIPLISQISCVFDASIDVHDNSLLLVDFANGARMSIAEIFFAPDNKWEFILQGTEGHAKLQLKMAESHIEIHRTHYGDKPKKITIKTKEKGHVGDEDMRDALVKAYFAGERISPTAREGRAGVATIVKAMESKKTGKAKTITWPDKKY